MFKVIETHVIKVFMDFNAYKLVNHIIPRGNTKVW